MNVENIKYLCNRKFGNIIELDFRIHQHIADYIRKNTNLSENTFENELNNDNVYTYRVCSAGFETIKKNVVETIENISNEGSAERFCNHLLTDAGKQKSPRVFHCQMKNEYGLKDENLEWWVSHFFIGLSETLFCPGDYLGSDTMENIKKHIISSCGFSEEMENFLLDDELSEFEIMEIILGAPIPLTQKRALLESMNTPDSKRISEISECILEIDKALEALKLKDGELFTLTECWYDYDFLDENKSSEEPFFSFQALLNYISNMVEEETEDLEEGEEYTCWTEATKWVANSDGTATRVYTYTFVGNEICYFWRVSENLRNSFKGYVNSIELNLLIPFQVGDIVTLDCLPFAPVKRAVIIEITHNYDCCGVRILYRQQREINGNEEWAEGALKHGHGWNHYYPLLSPLYRLSNFTGELPAEEQLMLEVQRYVRQTPENGIKLEKFVSKSEPDDNELSEYLRKQSLDKCN